MPDPQEIRNRLDGIEAELRALGWWQSDPLPESAFENMGAFGMKTMAFPQWLQFVLIPRVREILGSDSEWPPSSHLAAHAVREFDGLPEAEELVSRLSEFDACFV